MGQQFVFVGPAHQVVEQVRFCRTISGRSKDDSARNRADQRPFRGWRSPSGKAESVRHSGVLPAQRSPSGTAESVRHSGVRPAQPDLLGGLPPRVTSGTLKSNDWRNTFDITATSGSCSRTPRHPRHEQPRRAADPFGCDPVRPGVILSVGVLSCESWGVVTAKSCTQSLTKSPPASRPPAANEAPRSSNWKTQNWQNTAGSLANLARFPSPREHAPPPHTVRGLVLKLSGF
jgi:hypothetical protein